MSNLSEASSPKKVAIFLPSLNGGGAERVMAILANEFVERGILVDVVLARAHGPYLADLSPKIRVVDFDSSRVLFSLPALVKYIRIARPDAMLCALSHANIVGLLAKYASLSSTRVVVSERSYFSAALANSTYAEGLSIRLLASMLYRIADGVIAVSKAAAKDLSEVIRIRSESISVIYNPVPLDRINKLASCDRNRASVNSRDQPLIVAVGRLAEPKDFQSLIRAFSIVRERKPSKLLILGEGPLRQDLEDLVRDLNLSDFVSMPGFVRNPYVWMKEAEVYVLSSKWEGFPNSLVEAMACGTKIVSTDCNSGPAEILEEGRWGRLVPVSDHLALAKALVEAIDDQNPPDVSVRAAEFSVKRSADAYLDVLAGDAT